MEVLAYYVRQSHLMAEVPGSRYATLQDILAAANILTLHVPSTDRTHHLINREAIGRMKPEALLVNTSRGGVVDTDALLCGLEEGIIRGAGLDVADGEELISEEPALLADPRATTEKLQLLLRNHALLRRDNVLVTPHTDFCGTEALQRIGDTTVANILAFLEGTPQNLVAG